MRPSSSIPGDSDTKECPDKDFYEPKLLNATVPQIQLPVSIVVSPRALLELVTAQHALVGPKQVGEPYLFCKINQQ